MSLKFSISHERCLSREAKGIQQMAETRTDVFIGGPPPSIGQDAVEDALVSLGPAPLQVAWQQDSGFGVVQLGNESAAVSACQQLRQVRRSIYLVGCQ
jgi:hypothetical protein